MGVRIKTGSLSDFFDSAKETAREIYSDLIADIRRTSASVNRDLKLLSKYHLVRIVSEEISGHGICKTIEPLFGEQLLEFRIEI